MTTQKTNLTLGLDLGTNSIGWALLSGKTKTKGNIVSMGVRVFEAGLDDPTINGKGNSRNTDRRKARGRRRILSRRKRRIVKLASLLQRNGLFPDGDMHDSNTRNQIITKLDNQLESPYTLRAKALDEKLSEYELGRTFYHLAQRRGFLSNRKSQSESEKETGQIKKEIGELGRAIEKAGCRTLGEYFSKTDPKKTRIRNRHTHRKMYMHEFEAIWETQKQYYPELLTDEYKKAIYHAVFYQRPLKSQKHLTGECELEKGQKRAPWALLETQRFRYTQRLNDLCVEPADGSVHRKLTDDERKTLIDNLETKNDVKFTAIRKLPTIPKKSKFNLEFVGEKGIIGNKTAAKLIKIFGEEQWSGFSEDRKQAVVEDIRSFVKEHALKNRGMNYWKLDEESAKKMSKVQLEDGYCNFSKKAIRKLMPLLEQGIQLQTAIKELYPDRFERQDEVLDLLPPIDSEYMTELRNPVVNRSLTEVRKVVNSIIRECGKPDKIHIELARELRQTPKQRESTMKRNRDNENTRKKAAAMILEERGIENPSQTDILKIILADECGWLCPYTGKTISITSLISENPQFDIEHIIPFQRSLDNSFLNKTLCDVAENRRKSDRTPYEAYYGTDRWDEILTRVSGFNGNAARIKLQRFIMDDKAVEEFLEGFSARQLNDTRWTSKWAKQYLGLLYGGVNADGINTDGKRCVQATNGPVTAYLRNEWKLNSILGDGPGKSRDDHRHHAVDAVVIALSNSGMIKALNDSASQARSVGKRLFAGINLPWMDFYQDVKDKITDLIVSHRVSRRVRGALHEEIFYSMTRKDENGKEYVHIRKPLELLTVKMLEKIVDPRIREIVKQKLSENGNDIKIFKDPQNHPYLENKNGEKTPIHRVKIRENKKESFFIGVNRQVRNVESKSNHHAVFFEILGKNGEVKKWDCDVVSMYEAYQRLRNKKPVIRNKFTDSKRFLFSLSGGDIIELDDLEGENRQLYVVRTVPQSKQIYFVPINDARILKEIGKMGLTARPDKLRSRNCRKKVVTPLGEIRDAND